MSKKFNSDLRRIKDIIILCISIIPLVVIISVIIFLIATVISTLLLTGAWNIAMPAMFGLPKIKLLQAFILTIAIGSIRANYTPKNKYTSLNNKIIKASENEKISKTVSTIFIIIIEVISIIIAVVATMYSWNYILPELLGIELVHINAIQALGFFWLLHIIFSKSQKDD